MHFLPTPSTYRFPAFVWSLEHLLSGGSVDGAVTCSYEPLCCQYAAIRSSRMTSGDFAGCCSKLSTPSNWFGEPSAIRISEDLAVWIQFRCKLNDFRWVFCREFQQLFFQRISLEVHSDSTQMTWNELVVPELNFQFINLPLGLH